MQNEVRRSGMANGWHGGTFLHWCSRQILLPPWRFSLCYILEWCSYITAPYSVSTVCINSTYLLRLEGNLGCAPEARELDCHHTLVLLRAQALLHLRWYASHTRA